ALGGTALVLITRLGHRIEAILRENYDSVVAMVAMNEALERLDSSFTLAVLGDENAARMYADNWKAFDEQLEVEKRNITILPREQELVDELERLWPLYRAAGDAFYRAPPAERDDRYRKGKGSHEALLALFERIKEVVKQIRELNQDHMRAASNDAREL